MKNNSSNSNNSSLALEKTLDLTSELSRYYIRNTNHNLNKLYKDNNLLSTRYEF